MDVAERAPIPHSLLLGRQRVSVTTFVYDDAGRLVEAVTVHDQEWLPEDVEKAAGHAAWQQHPHHCPNGHLLAPWLDEKGVELLDAPFEVVEGLCPACELLEDHHDDSKGEDRRHGSFPIFRRVADEAPASEGDDEPDLTMPG